ncbi:hypothetical protein [Arthrobacter sp. NicSoilB8]|uniref:hypothetical protein n=1 Tax=Arthrobacter sp. NicSoilB8 TaxID=2830998 RepID=UPI001CC38CE7|nr:hypothetical protein [Arthrobacter sp. NicSoilB8]BCW73455.1 hypothetical protein NicSoilB8_44990 [Arthrobacter sp. NicSoilB8]
MKLPPRNYKFGYLFSENGRVSRFLKTIDFGAGPPTMELRRTQTGMNASTRPCVDRRPDHEQRLRAHRLGEFGFAGHMSAEEIPQVTAELNASPAFRDENITAVADSVHYDTAGRLISDALAVDESIVHLTRLGHEDQAAALRRVLAKDSQPAQATWARSLLAGHCSNISQNEKN